MRLSGFPRILIAFALWAVWPAMAALAQAPPLEPDEPSPAMRHAQVIAHGVAVMPADEIGWRVTVARAVPPSRATAERQATGFVLAGKGVVALTDQRGELVARMAPGEALWSEPHATRAVVTLDRKPVDYSIIALVPATEVPQDSADFIVGAPFAAPTGDAFDIDLIRDVLNRAEESVVSTGPSPALLLVTHGTVFVESSTGLAQMTAGEAVQVLGDVVVTGAGRTPAAFVVARIGPEVPAGVTLQDTAPGATPVPLATPVIPTDSASVTITASVPAMDEVDSDEDGLTDARETALGTDPRLLDSDADGVSDGDEIDFYATDALDADTDADGLDDGEELLVFGSNPFLADTDGDDVSDSAEITAGSDPLDAATIPATPTPVPTPTPRAAPESTAEPLATPLPSSDSDSDLELDAGFEPESGTESGISPAPLADLDGDGLPTADEVSIHGTNIAVADSDGDGVSDGDEVEHGTDPLDPT